MTAPVIFWISAALVVYVFLGYPVVLCGLQIFRRRVRKENITPTVSLLVPVYNEAAVIAAKLRNALALDYPSDRLEIVIASDGSTDETEEVVRSIVREQEPGRIRLLTWPRNQGKVAVLNLAVPELRGDMVVFSDASCLLAEDALGRLMANFADEHVGAASGVYQVLRKDEAKLGHQEDFYWRYETFLKKQEANIGALVGAHGSLYAVRRSLYPFPPPGTVNDDFVIPTSVLRRGFHIAYEPQAIAYEEAEQMEGFQRRVRITAGNIDQLRQIKDLLWPPQPLVLFCFLSHKAARLAVPLGLIGVFATSILLRHSPFFAWALALQILFYGLALLGGVIPLRPRFLRLPFYFCMINASLFGWLFYRALGRARGTAWR
jgi:cellulose synthase/poly-beta-1,6-N-acetylglucosamine synthase-like glycosyltransferase